MQGVACLICHHNRNHALAMALTFVDRQPHLDILQSLTLHLGHLAVLPVSHTSLTLVTRFPLLTDADGRSC